MIILLSGSTGFLGSYLLKFFIDNKYQVIALKRSTSNTYRIDDLLKKVTFYNIDEVKIPEIFHKHKIDIVVNTVTNYGRKDNKISSIVDTNLMFGLKLLEESVNNNVKAIINTDTLLEKNINAYALSKAHLVDWMKFLSNQNTKMINIKIEHMYGPKDDENKFIYWLINQLKNKVKKIDLTSGIQKRDFIYVDDIVYAYEAIIENIEKLSNFEEIELGSGTSIKVKDFIEKIYSELSKTQTLNTKLNFGAIPYRDNENMNMQANTEKLKKLNWNPKITLENGIREILNEEVK